MGVSRIAPSLVLPFLCSQSSLTVGSHALRGACDTQGMHHVPSLQTAVLRLSDMHYATSDECSTARHILCRGWRAITVGVPGVRLKRWTSSRHVLCMALGCGPWGSRGSRARVEDSPGSAGHARPPHVGPL